jgi:hypothetical protein
MNKALTLALLLCVLGGSMAANVYFAQYATSDCDADGLYVADAVATQGSCAAQVTTSADHSKITVSGSAYTLSYNCDSTCTANSCDEEDLAITAANTCTLGDDGLYYKVSTSDLAGTAATAWYVSLYSSATASASTFILEEAVTFDGSQHALTVDSTRYGTLTATTEPEYTVQFGCATGQASCTIDEDVTVGIAATAATEDSTSKFFVKLTPSSTGFTAPTEYVITRYSASGCAEADYVDEDTVMVDETCNAETITTTDYAQIVMGTWPTFALSYGCPTSGCVSANCDLNAVDLVLENSCVDGGDDYYYSLTAYTTGYTVATDDTTSAATTSFYAFALIALLFAALF